MIHCRDREAFAQAFLVFAQASQLDIPPGSAELYLIVLQQYPWELVERGLQRAMRRCWSTFPPPSALAELIEEVIAHDLVEDGNVALAFVKGLPTTMQRESREVKAEALGVLGEAHVATYLSTHYQVEPMSLKYRKLVGVTERLPFVLEVACGWYSRETTAKAGRRNLIGINWTPALKPPFVELPALAVRSYIGHWHEEVPTDVRSTELDHDCPTRGSANRYRFAVFLEKEGFYLLLEAAQIAERYDIAIMITKGMSVTAARKLVDEMSQHGVTVLVCHDFDKSGFSILHTLRTDTRRYTFHARPTVVDLGLRLVDVQAMDLQSEPASYPRGLDPGLNLREYGPTEAECHFFVQWDNDDGWIGQRVELNAMTSDQFIDWLERKLADAGVQKVVPDHAALENAYRRAVRQKRVQEAIEEALTYIDEDEEIAIPSDLEEQILEQLDGSAKAWDHVLWDLVADDESEDEDREDSEDGESPGHRPPGAAAGPGSVHAREYAVGVTTE